MVKTSHKANSHRIVKPVVDVFTWSAGLDKAGATDVPATKQDPERISLMVPLMPRRRSVLAANSDPLAQVERRRIKPWNDEQSTLSKTTGKKGQSKQYRRIENTFICVYRICRCAERCLAWGVADGYQVSSLRNQPMIAQLIQLLRMVSKGLCNAC